MELIELAKLALGGAIDLDPASHAAANAEIGAKRFYTKAEDGLRRPWFGRVWVNPPFSLWPEFSTKLLEEWRRGEIDVLLALVSCMALTTQYLSPVMEAADLMIIPQRRFKFWGPHAGEPTNGHVLLGFARTSEALATMREPFQDMAIWAKSLDLTMRESEGRLAEKRRGQFTNNRPRGLCYESPNKH